MIDGHGELVWFFPAPAASNVRAQLYRGKPVLTWFEGAIVSGHGEGHYELFDSSYQEVAQVHANGAYQGDLHEFLLTDAGTALFTCYGQATGALGAGEASDGAYYYGVVQEVDVATGRLLFEWRSDEHVSFDESYVPRPASPDVPWDYFHINSIDVDPIDGNLIISSRNAWAAYKLDRSSGEVLWRLGGKLSDFAMGTGACFAFQHDVRRHPDGTLTLFDDQAARPTKPPGRGAWYSGWTKAHARRQFSTSTTIHRHFSHGRSAACKTSARATALSAGAFPATSPSTTAPGGLSSTGTSWPALRRTGPSSSPGKGNRQERQPSPSPPGRGRRRSTQAGTEQPKSSSGRSSAARTRKSFRSSV